MEKGSKTEIRLYGCLRTIRKERGLPPAAQVELPEQGCAAIDIARELDLPLDRIEGVFVNHIVYSLDRIVRPGDEVALIPTGVPGPHRFLLGIKNAGKKG